MPYLGQSPSKGDENNFKILDDISSYTLTFDGSDASVVSAANDTITSLTHRFVQGQRVTYTDGDGSAIAGLTDATVYFIIKEDHNTIKLATSASNASNGVAVNITNVGSGSSHTLNVAFDGVNTKFKATHTSGQKARITRSAQLVISMNGVIQQPHDTATPSTGFGFDLDGTIVFSQAPVSSDVFWAHVLTNNNVTFDISDNDIDNFTGDGSTVSFNLTKSPPDNRNVLVTVDGVVQYPNDPDGTERSYTVVENVLTFAVAPPLDVQIQVRHIGFAGSTSGGSSGVTNFYGRTGSVVLTNSDNITVNDAAITGDATVTGNLTVNGTTTTLDTQLVEVDKIEVETAGTNVAVAVTHNGSGDLIRLHDGASQVVTVDDEGKVGIGSDIPGQKLDVGGTILTRSTFSNTATFSHNVLQFQTSGGAHIDHGTVDQNLNFRVSKSSTADTNMMQINAGSEQTKFHKVITVGLQGGSDTTQIGGGSGIGAYLQLNYASGGIVNTKLLGNGNSWLNSRYGNLGIGTQTAEQRLTVVGATDIKHYPNTTINNDRLQLGFNAPEGYIKAKNSTGSPAANIALYTTDTSGNTNRTMHLRYNGDVGIGTITPNAQLDVYKTGTGTVVDTIITRTSGGGAFAVQCSDVAAANPVWALRTYSSEDLVLSPGGHANLNEKVRIKANTGNVGIGTDDPDEKLHVYNGAGDVTSFVEAIAGDALLNLSNSGNGNYSGINFIRERGSGQTGRNGGCIFMPSNTANNEAFLYIQAQSTSAQAGVTGALSANNGVRLKLHGDDGIFSIETGADERLRIDSAGNVGISTNDPQTLLHLKSSDPTLRIQRYDQSAYGDITADTAGKITFKSDPGGAASGDGFSFTVDNSEKVSITKDGTVGIGTISPASMLHIHSVTPRITMSDSGTGAHHRINADSSVGNFAFDIDYDSFTSTPAFIVNIKGDEKFRVTSGGLDVTGSITADDLRTDNSQTFYLTTANDFRFRHTGGSEKLRIDSSGRLLTGGATSSQGSTNSDDLQIGANDQANQTGITLGSASASGIRFADAASDTAGAISYYHSDDTMRFTTGATGEKLRITSNGNVDINGTPPWTVTGGNYRNLSISGEGASASGFLWLGNGAATNNADFDLTRINICNGANIVAQITGTTDTSDNDTGRLVFYTRKHGDSSPSKRLSINSTGGLQIFTNTGTHPNVSATASNHTGSFTSAGLVLSTPAYNEYHFTWTGQQSYTIDFTCGSYFHSEFVYVQHQTNGGHHMHHYVRGKWANNHYAHTGFIYEHSGNGGALSVSFTASDQSGGGAVDMKGGLTEAGTPGATYRARYGGGHEGSSTTNNGRFRISETMATGSVSTRAVILKIYFGSLSGASIS